MEMNDFTFRLCENGAVLCYNGEPVGLDKEDIQDLNRMITEEIDKQIIEDLMTAARGQ